MVRTINLGSLGTSGMSNSVTRIDNSASLTTISNACNESKKHNNDEKAFYHGLKSAYRMSREYDGQEYGTEDPDYRIAAKIARNVAVAYLKASGQEYTREESRRYMKENFARSIGYAERFSGSKKILEDRVGEQEFGEAIGHAWYQVDSKENHYDAARTTLVAANTYLGEKI